jgi:hypothetical protein
MIAFMGLAALPAPPQLWTHRCKTTSFSSWEERLMQTMLRHL